MILTFQNNSNHKNNNIMNNILMKQDRPQPTPNGPKAEPKEATPKPNKKTFIYQFCFYYIHILGHIVDMVKYINKNEHNQTNTRKGQESENTYIYNYIMMTI